MALLKMSKRNQNILYLLLILLLFEPGSVSADDEVSMGVFPRRNAIETINMFTPLVDSLSAVLEKKVSLVISKDFQSFWKDVLDEKYDIVHFNQYHYIKSHALRGYEVILKNEELGNSSIASVIVVGSESNIDKIEHLKGKKIMFGGGRDAMMSYIVPTMLLKKGGLSKTDYEEVFAKDPPNALLSTYFNRAHAAGIGSVVIDLPKIRRNIPRKDIRLIAKSIELTHLPWAVSKGMDERTKFKIQSFMSSLSESNEGKKILGKAGLTNLYKATDKDYNLHREIVFDVLGEKY